MDGPLMPETELSAAHNQVHMKSNGGLLYNKHQEELAL